MLERHAKSKLLPDLYVFPGGRVEDGDQVLRERLSGFTGHDPRHKVPHLDPERVATFLVAAIRETFEEAGILFARKRGSSGLLDPEELEPLLCHRLALQSGDLAFADIIERNELELAAECLTVHGHWITPEVAPWRFDTVFFSALAPPGQRAQHDGVEASSHIWIRPEDALDQMRSGQRQIIFPTACNLETLGGFRNTEQVLAASLGRPVLPVLPVLEERDGQRLLVIPSDAGYPTTEDHSLATIPRSQPQT